MLGRFMRKRPATRGQHSLEHLRPDKESKMLFLLRHPMGRFSESLESPEIQVATHFANQTMGHLSRLRGLRKK